MCWKRGYFDSYLILHIRVTTLLFQYLDKCWCGCCFYYVIYTLTLAVFVVIFVYNAKLINLRYKVKMSWICWRYWSRMSKHFNNLFRIKLIKTFWYYISSWKSRLRQLILDKHMTKKLHLFNYNSSITHFKMSSIQNELSSLSTQINNRTLIKQYHQFSVLKKHNYLQSHSLPTRSIITLLKAMHLQVQYDFDKAT